MRNDSLQKLLKLLERIDEPAKVESPSSLAHLHIWHFSDLNPAEQKLNQDFPLKKIIFDSVILRRSGQTVGGILWVVDLKGNSKALHVPKEHTQEIMRLITTLGGRFERSGTAVFNNEKLSWHASELDQHYNFAVQKVYHKIIHPYILGQLESKMEEEVLRFNTSETLQAIHIVDMGCGQAPQLSLNAFKLVKVLLNEKAYGAPEFRAMPVRGLAFEFEASNVAICQQTALEGKYPVEMTYTQGDAKEVRALMQKHLPPNRRSTFKVVLQSGLLTGNVLNHFECLHIMQELWQAQVHLVVGGGRCELLMTRDMLSQMGYLEKDFKDVNPQPDGSIDCQLQTLVRQTSRDQIEKLRFELEKTKPKRLDLALSPIPELLLESVADAKWVGEVVDLDLSFSTLRDAEKLACLNAKNFPQLNRILYYCHHFDRNLLKGFIRHLPDHICVCAAETNNPLLLFDRDSWLSPLGHAATVADIKNQAINRMVCFFIGMRKSYRQNLQSIEDGLDIFLDQTSAFQGSERGILMALGYIAKSKNKNDGSKMAFAELKNLGGADESICADAVACLIRYDNPEVLRSFIKDQPTGFLAKACADRPAILFDMVDQECLEIVRILQEQKVQFYPLKRQEAKNNGFERSSTLLTHAITKKKNKVILLLAEVCPALLNARDERNSTPVEEAVFVGNIEALRCLLKLRGEGATIDIEEASQRAYTEDMISIFFEAGVDLGVYKDQKGVTPLQCHLLEIYNRFEFYYSPADWDFKYWSACLLILLKTKHPFTKNSIIVVNDKLEMTLEAILKNCVDICFKYRYYEFQGETLRYLMNVVIKFECLSILEPLKDSSCKVRELFEAQQTPSLSLTP